MSLSMLARYPFLPSAAGYVKKNGPTLNELMKEVVYGRARTLGKMRVEEALEYAEIKEHDFSTETNQVMELLSYIVARILVSCVNDSFLIRRYALAESKRAYIRLQAENVDFAVNTGNEFGLGAEAEGKNVKIHFTDYLKHSSNIKNIEWKLVNRKIEKGYAILREKELERLIQEALRKRIESELPLPVNDEILKTFKSEIVEIKNTTDARKKAFMPKTLGKISIMNFPPCMRHLLGMMQEGENVSHSGRFALTTFLHAVGMDAEQILSLFSSAPDFDEHKSRYQIEHITGKTSGTEYTPPECRTMKTYGICVNENSLCMREWMTHPLKYYRTKEKEGRLRTGKKLDIGLKKAEGELEKNRKTGWR